MDKNKYIYIHTLNGKPAYYNTNLKGIYYYSELAIQKAPANSLTQIQKEQTQARETDKKVIEQSSRIKIIYSYVKYLKEQRR